MLRDLTGSLDARQLFLKYFLSGKRQFSPTQRITGARIETPAPRFFFHHEGTRRARRGQRMKRLIPFLSFVTLKLISNQVLSPVGFMYVSQSPVWTTHQIPSFVSFVLFVVKFTGVLRVANSVNMHMNPCCYFFCHVCCFEYTICDTAQ